MFWFVDWFMYLNSSDQAILRVQAAPLGLRRWVLNFFSYKQYASLRLF